MAVFLILNYLQNSKHSRFWVSTDIIGYYLTGRFIDSQKDKNLVKGIKKGFELLIKEDDIVVLEKNRNYYLLDSKSCYIDIQKHNFTIIRLWELQKIFSAFGAYGFNILRFFINIVGTINGDSKSWHMTQDDMANNWNMSKNTVIEYFHKLEELKLIYTFRSNARKMDETFHRIGNVYGRYVDKNLVIEEGRKYLSTVPNRPISECPVDRVSVKLRYNAFCNGAKKYQNNPKLIRELYLDCIKYNESLKTHPNKDISLLDLSVFKGYGFKNIPVDKEKDIFINDADIWGEPDPMEKVYSVEEILDMPVSSDELKEFAELY